MRSTESQCFIRFLVYLYYFFFSFVHSSNSDDPITQSLDSIFHGHAFRSVFHPHPQTGALYNATVPANLAGVRISVVRLRSRTLWRTGANFSGFFIPPRTLPKPYVRRLVMVYHDLGNWSSHFFNVSGYSLITNVVGFVAYDASFVSVSNLTKLDLDTMGKPILVKFNKSSSLAASARKHEVAKCAAFDANGKVYLSNIILPSTCFSRSQGHFSIVMPNSRRKKKIWGLGLIGFLLGFAGLVLVGLVGILLCRVMLSKRTHELEKEAGEGEVLETVWIHGSKLPRAIATRSHPTLETTGHL